MIRVRFAPSPTGNLHIGTLRTALFNWLFCQNNNGVLVLRIEDTDLQRSKLEFEDNILAGLDWLGITIDEGPHNPGSCGPYRQSERIQVGIYKKYVDELLKQGKAYYCFETEEELSLEREDAKQKGVPYVYSRKSLTLSTEDIQHNLNSGKPFTVRFKIDEKVLEFNDLIKGKISFDCSLISDFIIMKSDGSPSYNFACAIDDIEMSISHVIRGEDHISNTPRQILLIQALGGISITYAHMPMILGPDKAKLSKRHGATSITEYGEKGYLSKATFNFLSLLGWSPKNNKEVLSIQDIVSQFSLSQVSKSNAIFDIEKLKWMNGQYIRSLDSDMLYSCLVPFVNQSCRQLFDRYDERKCKLIFNSIKDNLSLLTDVNIYLDVYLMEFVQFKHLVDSIEFSEEDRQVLSLFLNMIKEDVLFDQNWIRDSFQFICSDLNLGKGKVLKPIRKATTAAASGPDLHSLLEILGMDIIKSRLSYSLRC